MHVKDSVKHFETDALYFLLFFHSCTMSEYFTSEFFPFILSINRFLKDLLILLTVCESYAFLLFFQYVICNKDE